MVQPSARSPSSASRLAWIAARTLAGVMGSSKRRTPTASEIALAMEPRRGPSSPRRPRAPGCLADVNSRWVRGVGERREAEAAFLQAHNDLDRTLSEDLKVESRRKT